MAKLKYYKPQTKAELVAWFAKRYPTDSVSKFKKWTWDQIYAVYCRIMGDMLK